MSALVNDPQHVVDESIEGFILANPHIQRLPDHRVLYRKDIETYKKRHVTLISGGGSGHEPAHAGFIGDGMLSAVVAGDVFASPTAAAVLAAIRLVAGELGVLVIIKNYTGDRLHFGLAVERAKAEGLRVEMVVVDDDCAIARGSGAGRRGLAGTVLVHKIAGALAAQGAVLAAVAAAARKTIASLGTMSVSLSPCTVPGRPPSFTLPPGRVELGLGIHGEPGMQQVDCAPIDSLVATMLDTLFSQDASRAYVSATPGTPVVVLVNNLGGSSNLELGVAARAVHAALVARGLQVVRLYCGTFMTALAMAGVSVTVACLPEKLHWLLDAPTTAPAWPAHAALAPTRDHAAPVPPASLDAAHAAAPGGAVSAETAAVLARGMHALVQAEASLNALDAASGDGDCGTSMAGGARAVLAALQAGTVHGDGAMLLESIGATIEPAMGGTSGALFSIMLAAAAGSLATADKATPATAAWAAALAAGVAAASTYGGAHAGDRTMLDALLPAVTVLTSSPAPDSATWRQAVEAASNGAQATTSMRARCGRASYVDPSRVTEPDAGAVAVSILLRALVADQ